ncbi:hypothetical protein [Acidovorax temperans]|uniref:hypothetical protein n=1 Tax=Acidovorax temperans TaxID=80878 RepID=UPI0023583A19|nr:hypothetical protein [Acidovorax temperans]WCT26723.1 hypothetical protein PQV96_21165 [Acidovorax temperans]
MTAPPSSTQPTLQSTKKGGFLAERLRTKGWSIRDAAQYLGVSRQRLYTVFEDPGRARLWECAIAGIPQCTQQIKEELRTARAAKLKLKPVREVPVERPEFEIGDEVVAIRSSGLADEDERAHIVRLRGSQQTKDLQLLVQGPEGEEWLPEKTFRYYFESTGLNIKRSGGIR